MSAAARSRFPFTASQWQELEHQALIFKYMVSGMPIPPDLLYTVRRSLDSSISSKLLLHHQPQLGWNCFQMGFGRKIDPEPGRCRRTDGKKWRCSKEAYADSKYCERHMHRGRNRSRKPVEQLIASPLQTSLSSNNTSASSSTTPANNHHHHHHNHNHPPTAIPIKNTTTSSPTSHHSFSSLGHSESHHHHHHQAYNNHTPDYLYSSQENAATANFLLDSSSGYTNKGYSYNNGGGRDEVAQERAFFSEPNVSGTDSSWQLSLGGQMKRPNNYADCMNLQSFNESMMKKQQQYYPMGGCEEAEPKKVMHHFFDEWPPKDKDNSWLESSEDSHSKIQLSISMPNSHDFFMAQKW